MPVYLVTFHAYRSWMPDHPRGYTKRGMGYVPTDLAKAAAYEQAATDPPTVFAADVQMGMIEHLLTVPQYIPVRVDAVAAEPSHVHVLVSWTVTRGWLSVRRSMKSSLTRYLNGVYPGQRLRLSLGASRKHVLNRRHFDYLVQRYLPRHAGACWFEDRGWLDAKREAREVTRGWVRRTRVREPNKPD